MKTPLLLSVAILLVVQLSACKKKDMGIQAPGPTFSMDKFEQNLTDYVNWGGNEPVGWAYAISQAGLLQRSAAFGRARLPVDDAMNFTVNKEINVASITKFYTAIAALQLIEANDLTIDSKIGPWLPGSWQRGVGVNDLTFKDLLKHESGLASINSQFDSTLGYEGLKGCIQIGVINSKSRNYLNVNFALFRVLIPSLWSALPGSPAIDIENDVNTQFMYRLYLQQNIFDRLGLLQVDCTPEPRAESTLYYNVNDEATNTRGAYYGDWANKSGGGGYFMTTMEMASVNAYFEHTDVLLPQHLRDLMKTHRLGMDRGSSLELHGKYYGKGGSIGTGGPTSQGVRTQISFFPVNGVECTVVMNCQGNTLYDLSGNNNLASMIYYAYNDAWE